ncbi:uncharacterized protein LOC143285080 isoform X2 [Babylonia areolata]|uniref:uncharacterized protein LOC143285080 isoform X2 n=1 Tax=Babylonia areolata TaxID=304850 RepID=UPI003FD69623
MVLKKTNCPATNSGNTMRKRFLQSIYQKQIAGRAHVIKCVHNIRVTNPGDGDCWEVDTAKGYIDDGGLSHCVPTHAMHFGHRELYSLNKKKRWLLDDIVADAVHDEDLAAEPFKVTLVHRLVPCHDTGHYNSMYRNVTHYYDSHSTVPVLKPTSSRSTRTGFIQKVTSWEKNTNSRSQRKKRPDHNKHFRGIQRKRGQTQRNGPRDTADNAAREHVPEIRYEIGEAEAFHSATKQNYYLYCNKQPGNRFRGFHKEKLEWYMTDAFLVSAGSAWGCSHHATECPSDADRLQEDGEEEGEWVHCPPPPLQQFSLWDLALTTQHRRQQRGRHRSPPVSTDHEACAVNSASSQTVKKHGKGSAILMEGGGDSVGERGGDMEVTDPTVSGSDSDDSSREEGDAASSMDKAPVWLKGFEEAVVQFEDSFSCCAVPDRELNPSYLQGRFEGAVRFAHCLPLTATFDLQEVWLAGWEGGGVGLEDWWLLCQAGARCVQGQATPDAGLQDHTQLLRVRVMRGGEDMEAESVNQDLKCWLTARDHQPRVMSVGQLLDTVCHVVCKWTVSRQSSSVGRPCETVSQREHGRVDMYLPHERNSRQVDMNLPHERYTGQVEVCSVDQAYHHLQSAEQQQPQTRGIEDLDLACSVTWCSVECAVCFTRFHDEETLWRGFSSSVTMTTCGHSFCRQCWQHHLVSSIMEGKTTLRCMEYKCETAVESTTVMSLVPPWVYSRWQQRVRCQTVERSGEWTWCPHAGCGLLARRPLTMNTLQQTEEPRGVPVACGCNKHWCLHCGCDAHWPITCAQLRTYTNMLRQNGDEEGVKTTYVEISSVQVKRCPFCRYPMEKNGGCSHMTCVMCQNQFCWVCLAKWAEHVTGSYRGCWEKAEETVELENSRVYPLPIQCYQTAVSFRYLWKQLDRDRHRTITACWAVWRCMGRKRGAALHHDPPSCVEEAVSFLKKGYVLLERGHVLLSNCPRHHRLARLLSSSLQLLSFCCDRVARYMEQPVKRILRTTEGLHTVTSYGQQQIHTVCFLAHCLASRVQGTTMQHWLLHGDHEHFVQYK